MLARMLQKQGPPRSSSSAPRPLSLQDVVELAGEQSAEDVRQLALRSQGLTSFAAFAPHLPALEGLSLSHNQLASLDGFHHLAASLVTLNVNNNQLASLAGLEACAALQHVYASGNRLRDLRPLAGLSQLRTVSCFGNAIASLDATVQVRCVAGGAGACAHTRRRVRHAGAAWPASNDVGAIHLLCARGLPLCGCRGVALLLSTPAPVCVCHRRNGPPPVV